MTITTARLSPLIRRMLADPKAASQLVSGKRPFKIVFEGKEYVVRQPQTGRGSGTAPLHPRAWAR